MLHHVSFSKIFVIPIEHRMVLSGQVRQSTFLFLDNFTWPPGAQEPRKSGEGMYLIDPGCLFSLSVTSCWSQLVKFLEVGWWG